MGASPFRTTKLSQNSHASGMIWDTNSGDTYEKSRGSDRTGGLRVAACLRQPVVFGTRSLFVESGRSRMGETGLVTSEVRQPR